eukprot:357655-Chlamydomonas_euryale.AAC.1
MQTQELGVKSWPTWGCGASKFPWSYDSKEVAYLLEGEGKGAVVAAAEPWKSWLLRKVLAIIMSAFSVLKVKGVAIRKSERAGRGWEGVDDQEWRCVKKCGSGEGCSRMAFYEPGRQDVIHPLVPVQGHSGLTSLVTLSSGGGEAVEICAGDLCTFPEGMSCTWDVRKPINKHYKFY